MCEKQCALWCFTFASPPALTEYRSMGYGSEFISSHTTIMPRTRKDCEDVTCEDVRWDTQKNGEKTILHSPSKETDSWAEGKDYKT